MLHYHTDTKSRKDLHTKNWSLLPHFTIKRIRASEKRTIEAQMITRPCDTQMH
jgi:hypothetical protein